MFRGTTPTLTFTFEDIPTTAIDYVEITLNQEEQNVIIKKLHQNGAVFTCHLSEKDTLKLKAGTCKVQCKVKLKDGNVTATKIETLNVNDVLNSEVML